MSVEKLFFDKENFISHITTLLTFNIIHDIIKLRKTGESSPKTEKMVWVWKLRDSCCRDACFNLWYKHVKTPVAADALLNL